MPRARRAPRTRRARPRPPRRPHLIYSAHLMGTVIGIILVTIGMLAVAALVWNLLQRQEARDQQRNIK